MRPNDRSNRVHNMPYASNNSNESNFYDNNQRVLYPRDHDNYNDRNFGNPNIGHYPHHLQDNRYYRGGPEYYHGCRIEGEELLNHRRHDMFDSPVHQHHNATRHLAENPGSVNYTDNIAERIRRSDYGNSTQHSHSYDSPHSTQSHESSRLRRRNDAIEQITSNQNHHVASNSSPTVGSTPAEPNSNTLDDEGNFETERSINERVDTETDLSVISNSASATSDHTNTKKAKKVPSKKVISFFQDGNVVDYMHISHIETFCGRDHALVDGAFYEMTKHNVMEDKDSNKFICVDNVRKVKKNNPTTVEPKQITTRKENVDVTIDETNQSIVNKKNLKSSKKRKESVTAGSRITKTKKKQKVMSKSMKSIQDVCGSTGNFGKLLFDALVKNKYINPTWKTNKVEFYDTVELNTPLSFAYG